MNLLSLFKGPEHDSQNLQRAAMSEGGEPHFY